jgi:hypothetical protein
MKSFERLLLLAFLLFSTQAISNDSLRVISFPRQIHFYTKIGPSFSQVEIQNPDLPQNLLFKPNPQSLIGFGFSYSWLGLGVSFTLPSSDESDRLYGKTQKFDFEAHYTMRRLMVDLTLKSYKGFYFSNPEKYISTWHSGDPYPQVPNLQTVSIAASFTYVFSPDRYSSNAAYSYTKAMRRSGGSWMMGGFFSINGVASDTSIVPGVIQQYVDPKLDLKGVIFSNIGVSFGYSHLFTIRKKNFISFTFLPGLSLQKVTQYSSLDGSVKEFNTLALRNIIRFSIGRNGDKYYWGLATYVESSTVKQVDSQLFLNSGHAELFFGYRLDSSNWKFMKKVDRVMHPRFLRFVTGEPPERN